VAKRYTQQTQNLPGYYPCGFDSHQWHQFYKGVRMLNFALYLSMFSLVVTIFISIARYGAIEQVPEIIYHGCVIKVYERYTNLVQITEIMYNGNMTLNSGDYIVTYKITDEQATELTKKFIECSNN